MDNNDGLPFIVAITNLQNLLVLVCEQLKLILTQHFYSQCCLNETFISQIYDHETNSMVTNEVK